MTQQRNRKKKKKIEDRNGESWTQILRPKTKCELSKRIIKRDLYHLLRATFASWPILFFSPFYARQLISMFRQNTWTSTGSLFDALKKKRSDSATSSFFFFFYESRAHCYVPIHSFENRQYTSFFVVSLYRLFSNRAAATFFFFLLLYYKLQAHILKLV